MDHTAVEQQLEPATTQLYTAVAGASPAPGPTRRTPSSPAPAVQAATLPDSVACPCSSFVLRGKSRLVRNYIVIALCSSAFLQGSKLLNSRLAGLSLGEEKGSTKGFARGVLVGGVPRICAVRGSTSALPARNATASRAARKAGLRRTAADQLGSSRACKAGAVDCRSIPEYIATASRDSCLPSRACI